MHVVIVVANARVNDKRDALSFQAFRSNVINAAGRKAVPDNENTTTAVYYRGKDKERAAVSGRRQLALTANVMHSGR
jgi:hypothetical protein